jgi:6-phosphogluconolactonase (cycloisomerase 2 family)
MKLFKFLVLAFALVILAGTEIRAASFLYAINDRSTGNQIFGFSVDETTGSLTALPGFPVNTGFNGAGSTNLEMITIDKLNRRLYAINRGSSNISAYSIDPANGSLNALPFSPIAGIANQRTVLVHPSGSPLIVGGDLVASYVVTPTTATPAAGSPYSPGTDVSPGGASLSRDGNFYYTGGNVGNFFAGFAVNAASGVLTALNGSPFDSGNSTPYPTATDAAGRLFVVNSRLASTRIYTTVNGIPATASDNPNGLTGITAQGEVHPNGNFFVLADRSNARLGVYRINGSGAATTLTAVPGSPFATGGTLSLTFTFNQAGNFIYIANSTTRNVSTFNFDTATGALTNQVVLPANSLGTAGIINGIAYVNFAPTVAPRTRFDFDGDGKADVSVFRPADGVWYLNQSTNGFSATRFGASTDQPVPADYDGDGKTDIAVYRKNADSTWYILQSSDNSFRAMRWGPTNLEQAIIFARPTPGDFDGDGKTDLAYWFFTDFLSEPAKFIILQSSTNTTRTEQWGSAFDVPIPADYDGDNKTDVAVFRSGVWYIKQSAQGNKAVTFGDGSDKLVPADYDGDGKTDVAVFRPSNGTWYLNQSTGGFFGIAFGAATDLAVPADYDGDGRADIAVYRSGAWYLNRSQAGFAYVGFGADTDKPIPNSFVP